MRAVLSIGARAGEQRGRALAAVLAFAALVAVTTAAAWLLSPDRGPRAKPVEPQRAAQHSAPAQPQAALESPSAAPAKERAAEVPQLHPLDPARFDGTGRIRGFVSIEGGIDFPQVWSIKIEPSRALIGAEHALERKLEFEHGEQEFAFDDLPLGGYCLRAQAFGLDSGEHNVLLARPGESDLYLTLVLEPRGFVEGRAVDPDGAGVADLPILLRPADPRQRGLERETRTRADGSFLIDDVSKGVHQLRLGSSDNPILPPIIVQLHGQSARVADIELPPLGSIEGRVVDSAGRSVADQPVEGYGSSGGRIQTLTDASGAFKARFLPAGRYTLFARSQERGAGKVRTQLEAGATARIEIELAR